jgi:multiple sugar transport system permease protein
MNRLLRFLCIPIVALVACAARAETIQLRFVCWDGIDDMGPILHSAKTFEAAHPNIKVKVESVSANYQEKLLAEYAAGVCPDVAMMDPGHFEKFARRGALVPLNQFLNDTPGFHIEDYYKKIVDAHSLKGVLYVLPRDIAPCGLVFYNKRLFREAGIPFPDGTWTWDFVERPALREHDFLWVMHHLTKFDASGRVVQWGYAPAWKDLLTQELYMSTGSRDADDFESPTKALMDDPRTIRAYEMTADLSLHKKWVPSETEINSELQTSARQMFTTQKVAMFQTGVWEVPQMRKENIPGTPEFFDWDMAMAPSYKDGRRAFPTGGSGYCIMSTTRHPREAWELTAWMAGPPGMADLARAGRAQPAIRKLALSSAWIPGPNSPKDMQYPHNMILTDQCVPYVEFGVRSPEWPEVSSVIGAYFSRIYDGTATAKEILTEGNARGQARLTYLLSQQNLTPFNWYGAAAVGTALFLGIAAWIYLPERGIRRTSRKKKENRTAYLFIAPWLIGLVLLTAGPMILSLLMSFSDWDIIQPAKWRGLGNYTEAAAIDPRFWVSLKATAVYVILSVPSGVAVALALALLLNTKVKGMPLWRTCYYLPSIASPVASSLIWKRIFKADGGLLNLLIYGPDGHRDLFGIAGLLHPLANQNGRIDWLGNEHLALPALSLMSLWGAAGGMIILLAGLQGVPQYLYEAAILDGANPWQRFKNVTVPMISPALFFCMITGIIGSFQVFTQAFVMTNGGPNDATMFYMLHLYQDGFFNLRMGYASALAWILFAIIMVLTAVQFRFSRWVHYEGASR